MFKSIKLPYVISISISGLIAVLISFYIFGNKKDDPRLESLKEVTPPIEEKIEIPDDQKLDSALLSDVEINKNANVKTKGSQQPIIFIGFLSIIANFLIALLIYKNHRERMAILSDKKFVQPEEVQKQMQFFKESVSECNNMLTQIHQNNESLLQSSLEQTARVLKSLQQDSQVHGEDVKRLMETFNLMNNKLDEKDKEIKRYKEGYDVSQIKKSVSGYIKVRDRINSYIESGKTGVGDLENLNLILESAIENSGVSEIVINIGDDYYDDQFNGKIDVPKIISTNDPNDDNKILSIDKIGYEILGNEITTVISKAKVTIYKHNQKEEL